MMRFRRFATYNAVLLAITGALLTWLSRDGRLDFTIAAAFFDPHTMRFPLQDLPLLSVYGHDWLKNGINALWIGAIGLAFLSLRDARLATWRFALWRFVIFAVCAALLIQKLKGISGHACPWALTEFGGSASWFPLFDAVLESQQGQCWPGGHASAGYILIAGWFAARNSHPAFARMALIGGLFMGSLMGFTQMIRGAHFLSHNLWTLWLIWASCLLLDALWRASARLMARRSRSPTLQAPFSLDSQTHSNPG